MKEKMKKWPVFIMALGSALIAVALFFSLHTVIRDRRLERLAAETVTTIKKQIGENTASDVAESGGYEYMGYLTIPKLQLELPMMVDWSDEKLAFSPCRYYGSLSTEDIVLMAHNYAPFFGYLKNLSVGDTLSFTDVNGQTWTYTVAEMYILPPSAVEEMTHSGYALTLFTCTEDNKNRLTVRCVAAESELSNT